MAPFLIAALLAAAPLLGDCVLCEQIRERNRNAPPPEHEFYEDYLEAQRAEGKPIPGEIEFDDSEKESKQEKE